LKKEITIEYLQKENVFTLSSGNYENKQNLNGIY